MIVCKFCGWSVGAGHEKAGWIRLEKHINDAERLDATTGGPHYDPFGIDRAALRQMAARA